MPIDDEDFESQSIADDRKLQLFTDRHEFTRRFAFYLNEDQPREQILYFYGDGGNGKSLLLKHLQFHCCKRFPPQVWQELREIPEAKAAEVADFVRYAKPKTYTPIPVVRHDFGLIPIKEDKPQDRFYGLLMLRRNLAESAKKYKFKFPNYDFACFWYLLNKGESDATLNQLFPNDLIDFLTPVVETFAGFPVVSQVAAGLKLIDKFGGIKRTMKLIQTRLGVSDEQADEIRRKDIDIELIDCLPKLFAGDLNAAMAGKHKPDRLVMLFDTHEKLWDEKRNSQGEKFWYQDEWFRRLLRALDYKLGIVVAVAGRDSPVAQLQWQNAPRFPIPEHYIDAQLVWHLSPADAKDYLHKVEIDQPDLADAVIKYASVNPDDCWENLQVHPFYLGLCADVVLAERRRGIELLSSDFARIPKLENKTAELTDRLLMYVDREVRSAVHSLSACRAFDEDLYMKLGALCHFLVSSANFEVLTSFSFVWKSEKQGNNWYRIHDLLRRLDADRDNEKTRRAHEVLEGHYREVGDVAEAIFHANRLDWERGVMEWEEVFDEALRLSHYEECESLLAVRSELSINSEFRLGIISRSEGDYYAQLARYAEAKQEYLEAVAAYDDRLILTPDDEATLNNKGLTLGCLGNLQAQLSEFEPAKQSYLKAIAVFDSALLIIAQNDISTLTNNRTNKGNALRCIGDLQANLSEYESAKQSYLESIAAYNSALLIAPDNHRILNNKGIALQSLGNLQSKLSEFEKAKQSYSEAIAAYNSALLIAPEYNYALNNKGNTLSYLGDVQAQLSQFEEAKKSHSEAIAAYDSALVIATNDISALTNKGIALQSLGQLEARLSEQARLSEFETAKQYYFDAISAYNSALQIAPDYTFALINKGMVLRSMGDLQAKLSEFEAAKQYYFDAITTYNSALRIAPNSNQALNNKGNALKTLGDLQEKLSERQEALKNWQEALEMFDRALAIAPNSDSVRNTRDSLQEYLDNLGEDT
ncbi:hypothetical protein QUB68_00945 [Microcoleus sp. A006_D1]|uniref:tetratricopeptide repeat protein n=1 Tax=Microcoleus sp. A006_D1 TaxID=3055267 RepID=UPI002FD62AF6